MKPAFKASEAQIEKAPLAEIEEKRRGEATKKVIRFLFDAVIDLEPALGH
jgi:hypothetical protein